MPGGRPGPAGERSPPPRSLVVPRTRSRPPTGSAGRAPDAMKLACPEKRILYASAEGIRTVRRNQDGTAQRNPIAMTGASGPCCPALVRQDLARLRYRICPFVRFAAVACMCKVSRQALAPVELRAYIRQIRTFRYRFRLINGIVAEIKGPSEEKVPLSGALSSAGPGSSARDPDLPRGSRIFRAGPGSSAGAESVRCRARSSTWAS